MSPDYFTSLNAAAYTGENLENQLKLLLRPVRPSPDFVDHLHDRLILPVDTTLERQQSTMFSLLLVACSLISGIAIVWFMRRFRMATAA